jgi:peptide deformylase
MDLSNASVLDIVVDPMVLRTVSRPLLRVDEAVHALACDMLATMYAAGGVGLAAIQIGRPFRVIVFDVAAEGRPPAPEVMINPVIEWSKKLHIEMEEGCLSIPGRKVIVSRPSDIRVSYLQLDGTKRTRELGGMHARVVQHEIDHLDGVLITSRRF